MASPSTPDHRRNRGNLNKSHFQQTVCLTDWWLVKAENDLEGRRMAVAGFTSRERQAMRVFSSAPILKRYDVFTIETTDGICVIFNGFMNKARTLENGFPPDVCHHFVFGFPPYWEEYGKKFISKESPSKDISGVNLLKKLSPQAGTVGGQLHVDSHKKDFASQGEMVAKGMSNSKKTKSRAVQLPQTSGDAIGGPEVSSNMSLIASEGLEKESCSRGPSGEDQSTLVQPMNCMENKVHDGGRFLSACKSYSRKKRTTDNLRKVELDKNNSTIASFDWDMSSLENILSHNEVRVTTRAVSRLKMKEKNGQTSATISGGEKIRVDSALSVGSEKVELAFFGHDPARPTDKIQLRLFDAGSVKDGLEQVPEIPNQDKGMRKVKTNSNTHKAKSKATKSIRTPSAADNQTDYVIAGKSSLSEKAKALDMETRRKLTYASKETPDRVEEIVSSASHQSLSFNRSRSGRLLMPTLEYWRNQRAIYDADGAITGIEEGIHLEQPRKGSQFAPVKKRKQVI